MLANAMAEVENVGRTRLIRVARWGTVGGAEAAQHALHFGLDLARIGKQHVRVDVALHRLAGAASLTAEQLSRLAQIDRPVQSDHVTVETAHLGEPKTAAFGKDDARDDLAFVLAFDIVIASAKAYLNGLNKLHSNLAKMNPQV